MSEIEPPRQRKVRRHPAALCLLALLIVLVAPVGAGFAQSPDDDAPATEATPANAETSGEDAEPQLGVAAFGVVGGLPTYRAAALNMSVQYRHFGVAARASWTPGNGAYAGFQVRGYPPLAGVPVPAYGAAGIGAYDAGVAPFGAVGAHLPLSQNWRLDLEGGAAWAPGEEGHRVAPYLSLGTSFAFAVDLGPQLDRAEARREGERLERLEDAGLDCGLDPNPSALGSAVSDAVGDFIRDARATYGGSYRGLEYDYEIVSRDVDGDTARVRVRYQGSVEEIATGERISDSGTARATFRWNGCSWSRTSLSY